MMAPESACEMGDQAKPERKGIDHPHLYSAGEDGQGQQAGQPQTDEVCKQHNQARGEAVGDGAPPIPPIA